MTTAPLTILQLLPALGDGGVERSAVEMAWFLKERGIRSLMMSKGGPLEGNVAEAGTRHVTRKVGRKDPVSILTNARAIARLVDAEGIDIIHARSRAPAWAGWLASRMARRPVAFATTFHGLYSHENALKRAWNGVMLKPEIVIANSQATKRHIMAVYGLADAQVAVAERGVEEVAFDSRRYTPDDHAAVRAEFGLAGDDLLLVLVGRLARWKGQHVLVEALAGLRDRPWKALLVGGGDGDYPDDVRASIAAAGLDQRIVMTGSRRDVPRLLAGADIAFSTSIEPEAFGRAAIEAQAMGVPVIASAHGGSLETVRHLETGLLVPPGEVPALGHAIAWMMDDAPRRTALGIAGREWVMANFTTRASCTKELAVLQELAARRRMAP